MGLVWFLASHTLMIVDASSDPLDCKKKSTPRGWFFVVFATLLVLSGFYVHWLVRHKSRLIRAQLPLEAYATLTGLNADRFAAFDGTPDERQTPEYARLKRQLRDVAEMHPDWASCFLLRRHANGDVYFFMDVQPSADRSGVDVPYGEIYADCPDAVVRLFTKPEGLVYGPYTDVYGSWLTAYFPLVDPATAEVMCLLGIDMERAYFYRQIVAGIAPWLLFPLALLVGVVLLAGTGRASAPVVRRPAIVYAAGALLFGLILSLMLFHVFRQIDRTRIRLEFNSLARRKTETVLEHITHFRDVELRFFSAAVSRLEDVTADAVEQQFRQFALLPFRRHWAWVPRVAEAERDAFETGMGLRIHDAADPGGATRSPASRSVHYPVTLVSAPAVFAAYGGLDIGLDLASDRRFQDALEEAVQTGLPSSTPLSPADGASDGRQGAFLLMPVADVSGDAPPKGCLVFLIQPHLLLETGLRMLPDRSDLVNVAIYDFEREQQHMRLLAQSGTRAPSTLRCERGGGPCVSTLIQPVVVFGRTIAVVVFPSPRFVATYRGGYPVLVFGLGVMTSLLLAFLVYGGVGLRDRLREAVTRKTQSLETALDRYERMGRISRTFSMCIHPDGTILSVSRSVTEILGCSPDSLKGLPVADLCPPDASDAHHNGDPFRLASHDGDSPRTQPLLARDGTTRWFRVYLTPDVDDGTAASCLHATCSDITDMHVAEQTLKNSEQRYKSLVEDSGDIIWELDVETLTFAYVSPAVYDHLGFPASAFKGSALSEARLFADPEPLNAAIEALSTAADAGDTAVADALHACRQTALSADGQTVDFETVFRFYRDAATSRITMRGMSRNVTYRRRLEAYSDLSLITLRTMVKPGDFNGLLNELVEDIRRIAGMTSVVIRLESAGDYPFAATAGMQPELLDGEDSLLVRESGKRILDEEGRPVLRCLCGAALLGRPYPTLSRTSHGTLWTNNLTETGAAEADDGTIPICVGCGYRSMALVPIRAGRDTVGLLKLNSTEPGQFTEEIIAFIEALTNHIGEAIERRKVQNYYSLLFDSMSEAVIVGERQFSPTGVFEDVRIVSMNPASETVFSLRRDEAVGHRLSAVLASVHRRLMPVAAESLRVGSQRACNYHDAILNRDFEMDVFPVGTSEFAIMATDVTQMTGVERSLKESRRQYEALIANIPGIVYRCKFDRDWTMEFISDGVQEMLDYVPADFYSGRISYHSVICDSVRERVRSRWKDVLCEQGMFNMEYPVRAKNGQQRWVIERGSGVFDPNGRLIALEGIIFDITDRKVAERAQERFAHVIEQSRDAILLTTENGVIVYANSAVHALTGYTKEESIGRTLPEFESPPINTELYHSMWKTLYKGQIWEADFPSRRKNGKAYTEHVVVSPVLDEKGRVENFVCICRDVTQDLQDVKERESLRDQLAQATKMESVGRLAGGVAHDFNNMLQGILGYSEMALVQLPPDNPVHADVQSIQNTARRAAELTNQLLVFARRSKKNPKVFDVPAAIEKLIAMLRRIIGSEVRLEWQSVSTPLKIKADPSQFDQAITNLCINARDALGTRSSAWIRLAVRRETFSRPRVTFTGTIPAGEYVSVSVEDNGCGIPKDKQQQVFEPFYTTKAKGKGTGLGLSTVYGIVQSTGGGIAVSSEVGKGTTFELLFPESSEEVENGSGTPSGAGARPQSLPQGKGETILLVDDEETILLTTCRMLESTGYRVLSTTSPSEAIKIVREQGGQIALLLTDVIMPDLNGPQLVDRILSLRPALPYLYMSGYTANLLQEHGVPESALDNIHKPFTRRTLAEKVRERLDRASPA